MAHDVGLRRPANVLTVPYRTDSAVVNDAFLNLEVYRVSLRLHFAWPLCVAVSLAHAQATPVDIIEIVSYTFTFESASGSISSYYHAADDHWYAHENVGDGRYYLTDNYINFWQYGEIIDLSGLTLDLNTMEFSNSLDVQYPYFLPGGSSGWLSGGHVSFGDSNDIVSWNIWNDYYSDDTVYWSDPMYLDTSAYPYNLSSDLGDFAGRVIYGTSEYGAPDGFSVFTNPGRWSTFIEKSCHLGEDWGDRVPCPDPIPPQNGCGPSGGVPAKCDQIAVAPVPPSLLLLASGLAGLGMIRRRSRRLAG